MKHISFELTMPNVGSWNGKWTGAEKKYFVIKSFDKNTAEKLMDGAVSHPLYEGFLERRKVGETKPKKSHYYSFGDGWGASVEMEIITAREANKRRKISSGFCGYEWMIDSIILHDEILNSNQRKEKQLNQSENETDI